MTAVIADDEELARRVLREYLDSEPDIEVVAECANGFETVKVVTERRPDVLFLDVQMPKLDGFEVLELIASDTDPGIAVVFVTAFDQYAMRAFEAAAVDYLLKPFSLERFREALARVRRRAPGSPGAVGPELRNAARGPGEFLQRIVVRDGAKVHVIPAGKLDFAEAQDDYIALHSEGRAWLKQQTIASLEAALDPGRFLRAHRSYLVNIEKISRVEPNTKDTWLAILLDGSRVPMSRGGYARFRSLVGGR
jgi:two-component system LytT family response regulator